MDILIQVCNGGDRCPKFCFLDVLFELERRRTIEERAWWDFQALDFRGGHRIPLRDALVLMKATHQDKFTMMTWQMFMESREMSNDDVTFNEIRIWLCNPPLQAAEECGLRDIVAAGEQLSRARRKSDFQSYKDFAALQVRDSIKRNLLCTLLLFNPFSPMATEVKKSNAKQKLTQHTQSRAQ